MARESHSSERKSTSRQQLSLISCRVCRLCAGPRKGRVVKLSGCFGSCLNAQQICKFPKLCCGFSKFDVDSVTPGWFTAASQWRHSVASEADASDVRWVTAALNWRSLRKESVVLTLAFTQSIGYTSSWFGHIQLPVHHNLERVPVLKQLSKLFTSGDTSSSIYPYWLCQSMVEHHKVSTKLLPFAKRLKKNIGLF